MAENRFWATTKINFGKREEDGSPDGKYKKVVFNVGDEVKGLDKEDMKGLWQAGALTQTEPEKPADEEEEEEEEEEASSKERDEEKKEETAKTPPATKATQAKAAQPKQQP